ncbi:hypothetical protein BGX33_007192 [Mortierella sp. NVP41]|nr:hypothetical protein BGX33_007192 [Mortierella sp. NVP41]
MESQVKNKDDNNEDDVGKNLNGKGNENEYGSDDDAELRIIELSKQRCIEAATAVMTILEIFEDEQIKYHGGHHAFTVYFAGTILILHLSMTKDLMVQSQIHERLQVCFRYFAILGPYWEDAAKKAQILRDLLTSQARDRQGGVDDDENDGRDEDDEDQDQDEDDGGSNDNDNDSVDDHGTATVATNIVAMPPSLRTVVVVEYKVVFRVPSDTRM